MERRRVIEVIPESIQKKWERWDVRGPLWASFVVHSILTTIGDLRKTNRRDVMMKMFIWICYLLSEWLVNFALDMISSKVGDYLVDPSKKPEDDPEIMAFWATFLLVHFGGPHTITAYALEDNALWTRTLFISSLQSGRVLYLILLAWRSTWLSFINIAMFVVGCIKCLEKTCALYSACIDNRRDNLISSLHPDDDQEIESSSHNVVIDDDEQSHSATTNPRELIQNFMRFFISLFADLVISNEDLRRDQSHFRRLEAEAAFKQVEDELGYAYDIFYTKTFVRSSTWGLISKFITISITVIVLVCIQIKVITIPSYGLSDSAKQITYALLIGALCIEIVEFSLPKKKETLEFLELIFSKWVASWLKEYSGDDGNKFLCTDLLTLCLGRTYFAAPTSVFHQIQQIQDSRMWEVTGYMKLHIFNHMKGNHSTKYGFNEEINAKGPVSIEWTKELDFHQSILTWHIAADICYHCDNDNNNSQENNMKNICKDLSDYILHLLVNQRFMLPTGTGLVAYRDTFAEIQEFLGLPEAQVLDVELKREICNKFLQEDGVVKRNKTKSALLDGCRLARSLREMEREEMWKFLANVWVEILGYAAINGRADHHAQQLRRGGEFLSHVWLLMAHLGLMEQFQLKPQNPPQSHSNHP